MLPSMPLLMTPMKEVHDDSSDTSDDLSPHHSAETEFGSQNTNRKPSTPLSEEPDILASNCTPGSSCDIGVPENGDKIIEKTHTPEKRSCLEPLSAQKKKKKTLHLKTLAALTPDSGISLENSAQNFAEAYFQKVKSHLDDETWTQFHQELVDFEARSDKQPVQLFRRMEQLLSPHPQLVEEFLAFLMPEQALEVNQFIPYLLLCKMKEFFRKLNILLMKRQARQVLAALETLATQPNVTLADVKSSILPLLKSSPLLTSHFLELLPGERPPDSLMTEFEKVDLKDDSLFETVEVPDCPDPYGSENCVCSCHAGQKARHCIRCGIKYLNGRVYLQYGKVLRPAKVTFKSNNHKDLQKWKEDKCHSRRRLLPKTMLSPSCIDHRLNADSEDDCGLKKSPRTPRIRTARPKVSKKATNENKEEEVLEGIFPLAESKNVTIDGNVMGELVVDCKMNLDVNDDHEFDDVVMEGECNTEEDEEEDKCLHSENESSLEAEDIGKELELGIDFSFENEEVEDIESNEVMQNDQKSKMKDHFEKFGNEDLLTKMHSNTLQQDNKRQDNKTNAVATDKSDLFSTAVKEEPLYTNMIQASTASENQCSISGIVSSEKAENTNIDYVSSALCNVKKEQLSDTEGCSVNVSCEPHSTLTKQDSEVKQGSMDKSGINLDSSCKEWTREEDKIILQTIQSENGLEQAFETTKYQLPNRSKEEIQTRFDFVLKLLKEMISDESNS